MPCYAPLEGYKARNGGWTSRRRESIGQFMTIACGQCLGCRLDHSREWAARIVHEASKHDYSSFLTLTYRDPDKCSVDQLRAGHYLPKDGSLDKKHHRDFMKRLRKRFPEFSLRYYHCGEYGDQFERPHYHSIIFGLMFPDEEFFKEEDGVTLFVSKTLEQLWSYGYSTIGDVTFQSAAYTARYCLKKQTGQLAQEHYLRFDEYDNAYWLQPEYATMSRGQRTGQGGIGKGFFDQYRDSMSSSDEVAVPGQGVFKGIPRYYMGMLTEEEQERLKAIRKQHFNENQDEYTPERLREKYKVKKAQVAFLKRERSNT